MAFDAENFGVGLIVGWASAYALYRARHRLVRIGQQMRTSARGAQSSALQNADSRYVNDLVQIAQTEHLAGDYLKLTDILVEPRFIPAQPLPGMSDEDDYHDIYDTLPRVHDFPGLHAPYPIDTLSIDELTTGGRAIAILGIPGSGRTTALLTIALRSLNRVSFKPPMDKIQQKLDAEEARLTEKERKTRIQERVTMQQRARERLADEKGAAFNVAQNAESEVPLLNRLMPVYVHMADLTLSSDEYGPTIDPAEPLVRAAQSRLGRIAAGTVPGSLYSRLNKGGVLLLLDGFDDLHADDRPAYEAWLTAFMAQYGENFVIASGPANGYGALTRAGFAPVFLRPWSDLDALRSADRWASGWAAIASRMKLEVRPPDGVSVDRAKANTRALNAFDLSLKFWANYAADADAPGPDGWLRAYLKRVLPPELASENTFEQIAQIGALQLDEGFITRARMEALSIGGAVSAVEALRPGRQEKKTAREDAESSSAQAKLLEQLRRTGLVVRHRGDRYLFRHPQIAAYLAGQTLLQVNPRKLAEKAIQPAWLPAIGYAAAHSDIEAAVEARLNAPADVLYDNTLEVSRWLTYAGAGVPWRARVLKLLGNLMAAQSQYPLIRERAAAAAISTRDPNAFHLFRRAIRIANPDVRRLACLGLGATDQDEAVRDLTPLLQDSDASVQIAAAMALGVVHHEQALDALLVGLTEGSQELRQAVSIALSANPEHGFPILHDAIDDGDMMIRRAAVFGLRRLKTTWSLIDIYRSFLEDEQWYVRSAAQQAFQESQFGRSHPATKPPPSPEALPWLTEWASKRGENIPAGEGASQMLLKALQEGESDVRALSAATLGGLGMMNTTRSLYNALRDRQENVRAQAYRALAELQLQMGIPLPAPG